VTVPTTALRIPVRFLMVLLPLLVAAGSTRAEAQTKTYVAHSGANVVSVIDPAKAAPTPLDFGAGVGPARVVIRGDGRAYVAETDANAISVIDTGSDAVLPPIPVGAGPSSLAVSPDGGLLYACNQATNTIVTFRVNRESGTLTPTGQVIETGSPVSIAFAGA